MMTMLRPLATRLLSLAAVSSAFATNSPSSSSTRRRIAAAMSSSQCFETGYLNAQDAADLDVELMSTPGFSLEQLMELAGLSVAEAVYTVANVDSDSSGIADGNDKNNKKKRVLLVCGPGNNGGDGLVAARHLYHFGFESTVVYPKRSTKTHFINLVQQLEDLNIPILDEIGIPVNKTSDAKHDIIVDAIFGFSFRGSAPREPFATAITQMIQMQKEQHSLLVSVDVPSSWDVNGGDLSGAGFKPDVLISLTAPKLSAKKFEGRHFVGGRFLPPGLAEKYGIKMPPYPGVSQVMEVPKSHTNEAKSEMKINHAPNNDWALEYQAFLEEKEKANIEESDKSENELAGDQWAKEYAAYCEEKEKEFFDEHKLKE